MRPTRKRVPPRRLADAASNTKVDVILQRQPDASPTSKETEEVLAVATRRKIVPPRRLVEAAPSPSKVTPKHKADGATSPSRATPKRKADAAPSLSKVTPKRKADAAPSLSKVTLKQKADAAPSLSKVTPKQKADAAPRLSKVTPKQKADAAPSLSKVTPKQKADAASSPRQVTSKQKANGATGPGQVTSKQKADAATGLSQVTPKQKADVSPSPSRATSKRKADAAPSPTQVTPKQKADAAPSPRQVAPKRKADAEPNRSLLSPKRKVIVTPSSSQWTPKGKADAEPSPIHVTPRHLTDDATSPSGVAPKQNADTAAVTDQGDPKHKNDTTANATQVTATQKIDVTSSPSPGIPIDKADAAPSPRQDTLKNSTNTEASSSKFAYVEAGTNTVIVSPREGTVIQKTTSDPARRSLRSAKEKVEKKSDVIQKQKAVSKNLAEAVKKREEREDKCVCCGKFVRVRTHAVNSFRGKLIGLKELVQRFGGIDDDTGNVCSDCFMTIQSLDSQVNKFYKRCQATSNKSRSSTVDSSASTSRQSASDNENQSVTGKAVSQNDDLKQGAVKMAGGDRLEKEPQSQASSFVECETQCDFSDNDDDGDEDDHDDSDLQDIPDDSEPAEESSPAQHKDKSLVAATVTEDPAKSKTEHSAKSAAEKSPAKPKKVMYKVVSILPSKKPGQSPSSGLSLQEVTGKQLQAVAGRKDVKDSKGTPSTPPKDKSGIPGTSVGSSPLLSPANVSLRCTDCKVTFANSDLLKEHIKKVHKVELNETSSLSVTADNSMPSNLISLIRKKHKDGVAAAKASTFAVGSKKFIFFKVYKSGPGQSEVGKLDGVGTVKPDTMYDDHTYDKDTSSPVRTGIFSQISDQTFYYDNSDTPEKGSPKSVPPVVCSMCSTAFFSTLQLGAHYNDKHSGLYEDLTLQHTEVVQSNPKSNPKYNCKLCDMQCTSSEVISTHIRLKHSLPCPYRCTMCSKTYTCRKRMKSHTATHFPRKKKIRCWKCEEEFSNREVLVEHPCWVERIKLKDQPPQPKSQEDLMDSDTEGDHQYPCPLCDNLLPSKKQLKLHWAETHNTMRKADEVPNDPKSSQADSASLDVSVTGDGDESEKGSETPKGTASTTPSTSLLSSAEKVRMFICSLCATVFKTTQALSTHWSEKHNCLFLNKIEENMSLQAGVNKYKCQLCKASFTSEAGISTHMRGEHSMDRPFKCLICDKKFTTKKKIRYHLSSHFPSSFFRCSVCNGEFKTQEELLNHGCWMDYVQQRMDEEKPRVTQTTESQDEKGEVRTKKLFMCSLCQEKFPSTKYLASHWEQTHDLHFEKLEEERPEPLHPLPKQTLNYQCEWCGAEFRRRRNFDRHRSRHLLPKSFRCKICQQTFDAKHKIRLHLRFHLSKRPHVCSLCPKSFMTAKHLRHHMRGLHGSVAEKKRYVCEECGKGFAFSHSLKRHKESAHTAESERHHKHKCEVCGKGFFVRSRLKYHMTTHLDHAPHLCNVCGKAFKCRLYLRIHQKNHTGENRHPCSICHERFSHKIIRTAHRLIVHHDGCPDCGLALFTKKDAMMHRRVCDGFAKVHAEEEAAFSVALLAEETANDEAGVNAAAVSVVSMEVAGAIGSAAQDRAVDDEIAHTVASINNELVVSSKPM